MADEIIARYEDDRVLPTEAEHDAVCVDIIDLGMVRSEKFNKTDRKCAIVFQLREVNPKTEKRHEVAERFTVSMFEKANLRKFLGQWRGKPYTDDQAKEGAPLHKLDGVAAIVTIVHAKSATTGKIYANVFSIRKASRDDGIITPDGYVRAEYWKKAIATAAPETNGGHPDDEVEPDDDLPF